MSSGQQPFGVIVAFGVPHSIITFAEMYSNAVLLRNETHNTEASVYSRLREKRGIIEDCGLDLC